MWKAVLVVIALALTTATAARGPPGMLWEPGNQRWISPAKCSKIQGVVSGNECKCDYPAEWDGTKCVCTAHWEHRPGKTVCKPMPKNGYMCKLVCPPAIWHSTTCAAPYWDKIQRMCIGGSWPPLYHMEILCKRRRQCVHAGLDMPECTKCKPETLRETLVCTESISNKWLADFCSRIGLPA